MTYLIIIVIIVMIVYLTTWIDKRTKSNNSHEKEDEFKNDSEITDKIEEYPYVRTYLLTKNEWRFYKSLKPITDKYQLHILAKIRIADIVNVQQGLSNSERYSAYNKIQSKHFDFVLANPDNLAVLCAIELDDSTHEKIERQKRDYFVENVCKKVDLPLIRTNGAEGIEDKICQALKINKK